MASNVTNMQSPPWTVADKNDRPAGVAIILLKRVFALPWGQFLYAQGDDAMVQAFFTTHDIVVKGAGLRPLVSEFAGQRLTALYEPHRTEVFGRTGACITDLDIVKVQE